MPFITFEGIDGSGKSTLIEKLAKRLKDLGHKLEVTREPGGTPLGHDLRTILLRTDGAIPCPEAELLIYEADRAQHVQTKIKPLLQKGVWVISDRHGDSSLAFQGDGRRIALDDVKWLNRFATGGLVPDVTILVDCPFEVAQKRRQDRQADRFEKEEKAFHETIRQAFLRIAKDNPERFLVLDSQEDPEHLAELIVNEFKRKKLL